MTTYDCSSTDLVYHRQDESGYAGAACAQMVLRQLAGEANMPAGDTRQSRLHEEMIGSPTASEYAKPSQLRNLLAARGAAFGSQFGVWRGKDKAEFTEHLAFVIMRHRVPPAVLVMGGPGDTQDYLYDEYQVTGTDGDGLNIRPSAGFDQKPLETAQEGELLTCQSTDKVDVAGYTWLKVKRKLTGRVGWAATTYMKRVSESPPPRTKGTWVLVKKIQRDGGDPLSGIGAADPNSIRLDIYHPHGGWPANWPKPNGYTEQHQESGASKCGSGLVKQPWKDGNKQGAFRSWGQKYEKVTFQDWRDHWLRPISGLGVAEGDGWLVAVCDPRPQKEPTIMETQPVEVSPDVIDPDVAMTMAKDAFLAPSFGFTSDQPWRDAFQEAPEPGHPELVERLDIPGLNYYVVPFDTHAGGPADPDNRTPLIARVDSSGHFGVGGAVAAPGGSTALGARWTRDRVVSELGGTTTPTDDGKGILLDPADLSRNMVWKPCLESGFNLNIPFWVFRPSSGAADVFVRIDGEIFTELTGGIG